MKEVIIYVQQNKTFFYLPVVLLLALLLNHIRTYKLRNTVRKTLKDNNILNEDTSIYSMTNSSVFVLNAKHSKKERYQEALQIITEIMKEKYYLKRIFNIAIIKKFPGLKKNQKGIFLQSTENGKIEKYKLPKNSNGLAILAKSGSGKSILANSLILQLNITDYLFVSPKGNEDNELGKYPNEAESEILEIIEKANRGEYKNKNTKYIFLDETITLSEIFSKETIRKIATSFSICRSQNLKWILMSQKINKNSGIDFSLINQKIINTPDAKNFEDSLGVKITTPLNSLKLGEFLFYDEEEKILINKI